MYQREGCGGFSLNWLRALMCGLALFSIGCENSWVLETELLPSGTPAAGRGHAIALDGNWALVGTHEPYGAELYEWDGTTWNHVVTFEPRPGTNPDARFGESVAIEGDTLVIGAPVYLQNAGPPTDDYGYLDVYRRNAAGDFVHQAVLSSNEPFDDNSHNFAAVAALSDGILAVGDPFHTERVGRVFLYKDVGRSFVPYGSISSPQVTLSNGDQVTLSDGHFGHALALSGDRLAIAHPGQGAYGVPFNGAVHVYRDNGSEFVLEDTIAPPPPDPGAWEAFGAALDLHGDELAVTRKGKLSLYRDEFLGWTPLWTIDLEVGDYFKRRPCVALGDETLVVGEYQLAANTGGGRVYEGASYSVANSALVDPLEGVAREFGGVVALSGNRLLVSTGGKTVPLPQPGDDSVYVYVRED